MKATAPEPDVPAEVAAEAPVKVEDKTSLPEKNVTEVTQSSTEPTVKAEELAVGEATVQSEVFHSFYSLIIMANSSALRQLSSASLITHLKLLLKLLLPEMKTPQKRFLARLIISSLSLILLSQR